MHDSILMPPHPTSLRLAREAVGRWLRQTHGCYSADAAVLLTGELVARALLAAQRDVTLSVTEHDGQLHIEAQSDAPARGLGVVRDTDGAGSQMRWPSAAIRGSAPASGVHLVGRAGCAPSAVAWFELDEQAAEAAAARACETGALKIVLARE